MARTAPAVVHRLKRFMGPPFDVTRLREAIARHPDKPSLADIAATLDCTHPTVSKYLRGYDLPLSAAIILRDVFAPEESLDKLWKQVRNKG